MKTKALFLAAAISAAGIASSLAQVYSVNAVGYVNQTVPLNFSLVANPFVTPTNTLNYLLPPASTPLGLTFYKFNGGGFAISIFDEFDLAWKQGDNFVGDTETLVFGDGAFLYNPPTGAPFTITWVGEVAQGSPVSNPAAAGFSIKSSKIPQAGKITTDLQFQPNLGDQIQKFNSGLQQFEIYIFDEFDNAWKQGDNFVEPSLGIAESAFFILQQANNWNRNFTVN